MSIARFTTQLDADDPFGTVTQPTSAPGPKVQITELLKVFAPLLALVLAWSQTDRARFWGILSLGALITLIGIYRPLFAMLRRLAQRRHNERVAREYRQEFRRIAREAGNFVDSNISRPDTLAAILNQVNRRLSSPHNVLLVALSRVPQTQIFMDRWCCFNIWIQKDKLNAEQFHVAVDELTGILRSHNSYCATPIFHTFASEYRELLMDNEKSEFNAFQQSYRAYLERLAEFVSRLNDDFRGLPELSAVMALLEPL